MADVDELMFVVVGGSLFASTALPRRAVDIVDRECRHLSNGRRPRGYRDQPGISGRLRWRQGPRARSVGMC